MGGAETLNNYFNHCSIFGINLEIICLVPILYAIDTGLHSEGFKNNLMSDDVFCSEYWSSPKSVATCGHHMYGISKFVTKPIMIAKWLDLSQVFDRFM